MFIHFSILMIITKKKGNKFDQDLYDNLFHNIENNLRELGFGDVSVNKKMKEFNKVLYDILLKIESVKIVKGTFIDGLDFYNGIIDIRQNQRTILSLIIMRHSN